MAVDFLDLAAHITSLASQPRGLRTDCQALLDELVPALNSLFGVVYLEREESGAIEIAGATGLTSAAFRRLEERVGRTALSRIFENPEPTRLLTNDEPTLDFLANPKVIGEIVCVPVMATSRCIGAVALAFDKKNNRAHADTIRLLEIAASLVTQFIGREQASQIETQKLEEENLSLRQELRGKYDLSQLIGNSSAMRSVIDKVRQVARSNAPVLLRGEAGSGKELIASAIHHNSLRGKGPFIKVNCSAIPDALIETELFGLEHVSDPKPGRIELAEGGTLFLDEIGSLPQTTQVRLLRLLQDREFERVGDTVTHRANVRLIAATSLDLEGAIADGDVREDLFYGLSVFTIFMPPLRDRKADILLLADHFLRKYSREHSKHILRISTPAIDMLTTYHFPGNVRELENVIEGAVLACSENVIHGHHLPPTLQTAEASGTETRVTLESSVSAFERGLIQDALKSTRGNIAKAAQMLESTERILGYKIRKYGIDARRFK